jgi:hypothetical protein
LAVSGAADGTVDELSACWRRPRMSRVLQRHEPANWRRCAGATRTAAHARHPLPCRRPARPCPGSDFARCRAWQQFPRRRCAGAGRRKLPAIR